MIPTSVVYMSFACTLGVVAAAAMETHKTMRSPLLVQLDGRGHVSRISSAASIGARQKTNVDEGSLARFLIRSTFGPTRMELEALALSTEEGWLHSQFELQATLHRAYFRERVNPRANASCQEIYEERHRCAKGSRWVGHAFTAADVGKTLRLNSSGALFVDDTLRTKIDASSNGSPLGEAVACTDVIPPNQKKWESCADKTRHAWFISMCRTDDFVKNHYCQQSCFNVGAGYANMDCSGGWAKLLGADFSRKICSVNEPAGMPIMLSNASGHCQRPNATMLNPTIWLSGQDAYSPVVASFESSVASEGVQFLADEVADCQWGDFIRSSGNFYRYDARMQLAHNTPGAVDASACAPKTALTDDSCVVVPKLADAKGCEVACGSPGEVANDPLLGHQFAMRTAPFKSHKGCQDKVYDNRGTFGEDAVRQSVWLNIALYGQDQLRQRMAWALSQIFVVGEGFGDKHSEPIFGYYDIFVANAFGNFRDVMRQVTFSPIMGEYLTYIRNFDYDSSLSWPDENYAREIMQLFTIGLEKLHLNGSKVMEGPDAMATYNNEHIMNFARVFTGFVHQRPRRNTECLAASDSCFSANQNRLDAMDIRPDRHDVYPKPDLEGGYLGDGYQWCSDLLGNSSISKGARYEFLGYSYDGDALEISASSKLYAALQAPFKATVQLTEDADCPDEACNLEGIDVVKVGEAFFEFVPQPCVYPFFYTGQIAKIGGARSFNVEKHQKCLDPSTALAGWSCCGGCENTPPESVVAEGGGPCGGCEDTPPASFVAEGKNCSDLSDNTLARKCTRRTWRNDRICRQTCWDKGYSMEPDNCSASAASAFYRAERSCSASTYGVRYETARQKCQALGLGICTAPPKDCDENPSMLVWSEEKCDSAKVTVHSDGKVSDPDMPNPEANRFTVYWTGDTPPPGTYDSMVKRKLVMLGNASFKNPPVFFRRGPIKQDERHARRAALNEVESLLDHLFHHMNTPVFISKKLIQRFVTSNPTAAYVKAVARAFKTGNYSGRTYSGRRGDLKATVAAILLHKEARQQTSDGKIGLFREPFLRLLHLMRSMEYADDAGQVVVIRELGDRIGQAPYESPTVFNFYDAMYMPPNLARMGMRSAELDPEPEPEPEPLFAPEFQVFTTPWTVRLHNGLSSLLEHGLSACDSGFGFNFGRPESRCKMGHFEVRDASGEIDLTSLDLLLTGGRLTANSLQAVTKAFDASNKSIFAAIQAIMFTPEFNTLGNPLPEGPKDLGEIAKSHDGVRKPYKATVLLYMGGGADTFHMLVPLGGQLYEEYLQVRVGLTWGQDDLIEISTDTQPASNTFGVHPKLEFVADLYKGGQAAFVSNIGQLVEPLTRSTFKKGGGGRTCPNGFSHSDATANALQMACGATGGTPTGHGGRIADTLAEMGYKVAAFSVAGVSDWAQGDATNPEMLDAKDGAVRYEKYKIWAGTIDNVTSFKFGNIYCDEYATLMSESLKSSEALGTYLDHVTLSTEYAATSQISQQLRQVARVIATREARAVERDFFHVKLGGFDTHRGTHTVLLQKFAEIDDAIRKFVTELKAQGVWESTVLFTESDFGRTLSFNGDGTDHGWGGNQIVIGGGLLGGKIHNEFLKTYHAGSEYDAGRGRVIPQYPWESIGVPLAEWNGITDEIILAKIFPNLGNFNRSTQIISRNSMFQA